MKTSSIMIPHVACPSCGTLSRIDYCDKNRKYTWWCDNKDECGKQYDWIWLDDGSIESNPTGTVLKNTSVLLCLPPQKKTIYLIVEGLRNLNDNIGERDQYFYEEHTCPINYLTSAREIIINGNNDPHGLFEYMGTISKTKDVKLKDFKI